MSGLTLWLLVRWHKARRHPIGLFYCHGRPCGIVIERIYGRGYGRSSG